MDGIGLDGWMDGPLNGSLLLAPLCGANNQCIQCFHWYQMHDISKSHLMQHCLLSKRDMWEMASVSCQTQIVSFPDEPSSSFVPSDGVNASFPDLTPHYTRVLLLCVSVQPSSD